MTNDQIRELLKQHGVQDADDLTDRELSSYRSMTNGTTDQELLKKKIKDWRKVLYASREARARRNASQS